VAILFAAPGVALAAPHDRVEQARLMETIRALPTARAPGPDEDHRAGLRETEASLLARVRELGLKPTRHEFQWASPFRPRDDGGPPAAPPTSTYHNIVVDLPGTDKSSEVVLVGAHFDAVPNSPGADDNGSGVAALLEMARVYSLERAAGATTRRTIRLAFFNIEEAGCIGSSAYYRDWRNQNPDHGRGDAEKGVGAEKQDEKGKSTPQPPLSGAGSEMQPRGGERIVAMLSLETMGYFSDEPNSQKSPFPPNLELPGGLKIEMPTVGDFIAIVGIAKHKDLIHTLTREMKAAAPGLKTFDTSFAPMPLPDMLRSDHRAFLLNGIPAVMVTDSANFRNPHYHKPTDTFETLDAARFTLVTRALVAAVWALAEPVTPVEPAANDASDKWHE
jgi:hypothetical protein